MVKRLSRNNSNIAKHMPLVMLSVFALLCAAIDYFWSPAGDDISYSAMYGGYGGYIYRGEDFPGLGQWFDFFLKHAREINGRLGDKFITLYLAVPRWAQALITGLSVWTIMVVTARIAFGKCKPDGSWLMLGAGIIIVMPWYDSFFLSCMVLNYGIATALAVFWIWQFLNPGPLTLLRGVGLAVLSILVGGWHEGFSVLFLPSLLLLYLFRKDLRSGSNNLMLAGFLAGVAFILSCPGFWDRMGKEYDMSTHSYTYYILAGAPIMVTFIALLFCAVRQFVLKRSSALNFDRKEWIWYVAVLLNGAATFYVIIKTSETYFRAWWVADLLSLSVLASMYARLSLNKIVRFLLNAGLTVFAVINLCVSLYWQILIYKENEQVLKMFCAAPHKNVYFDVYAPDAASCLTLRKVQRDVFMHHALHLVGDVMTGSPNKLIVLPREFAGLDTLPLRRVEENDSLLITPKGNFVFENKTLVRSRYAKMDYIDTSGARHSSPVWMTPFVSEGGKAFVYVKPLFHTWESPRVVDKPLRIW